MHLIILCDGTWNTPDQMDGDLPAPTNVVKLRNALAEVDDQQAEQRIYYHPGVGTDGGWWDRLAGGGMGDGLDKNIKSAYRWLAENYDPAANPNIWLFGFSRGAYTARSLGGMISLCGLFDLKGTGLDETDNWKTIDAIFDAYRAGKALPSTAKRRFHNVAPKGDPAGSTRIHFIGVWDTVGALGVPDDMALLNLIDDPTKHQFHNTGLSKIVDNARHAVAIDEKRQSFTPTLWTGVDKDPRVKQIWFPGAHGDVGGGYGRCGLSDGALLWMMEQVSDLALGAGKRLAFRPNITAQLSPDPRGQVHDSITGIFKELKTRPRAVPPILKESEQQGLIHFSALDRSQNPPLTQGDYWKTTLMRGGQPATVSVYARDRWNYTGLYLEAGRKYTFEAAGEWKDSDITCGPGGTNDGKFHIGEAVQLVSSFFGKGEAIYTRLTGNHQIDFWYTRREEREDWFSLIGVIANDVVPASGPKAKTSFTPHEVFKIGNKASFTPSVGGYLYAFANDAWQTYDNNRGSVKLTVS